MYNISTIRSTTNIKRTSASVCIYVFRVRLGYLKADVRNRVSGFIFGSATIQMKGANVMIYKLIVSRQFSLLAS